MGRKSKMHIGEKISEAALQVAPTELQAEAREAGVDVTGRVAELAREAEKMVSRIVQKDADLRQALEQNQADYNYWKGRADSLKVLLRETDETAEAGR
jgi:uncharacterized protein YpuA (DUF1002 family)